MWGSSLSLALWMVSSGLHQWCLHQPTSFVVSPGVPEPLQRWIFLFWLNLERRSWNCSLAEAGEPPCPWGSHHGLPEWSESCAGWGRRGRSSTLGSGDQPLSHAPTLSGLASSSPLWSHTGCSAASPTCTIPLSNHFRWGLLKLSAQPQGNSTLQLCTPWRFRQGFFRQSSGWISQTSRWQLGLSLLDKLPGLEVPWHRASPLRWRPQFWWCSGREKPWKSISSASNQRGYGHLPQHVGHLGFEGEYLFPSHGGCPGAAQKRPWCCVHSSFQ